MVLKDSFDQPLVTVVIPTYNRSGMLRQAVESVCDQSYKKLEILVVDDGSVDDTEEVVKEFGDSRLRYIKQENLGVSKARNRGIRESRGEFIAFLDSDDLLMPDCIRLKVELALKRPECALIGGGCRYFGDAESDALKPSIPSYVPTYADFCIFTAFPGGTCNIFVPKSAVERAGPFDESLSDSEDRDFLRRIAQIGEVAMVHEVLVAVRVHSEIRPNRDHQKVFIDRERVSERIPEPILRRKSRAWNAMVIGNLHWYSGRRFSSALWWMKSALIWPLPLHRELPRLKHIFWRVQSDLLSPPRSVDVLN